MKRWSVGEFSGRRVSRTAIWPKTVNVVPRAREEMPSSALLVKLYISTRLDFLFSSVRYGIQEPLFWGVGRLGGLGLPIRNDQGILVGTLESGFQGMANAACFVN